MKKNLIGITGSTGLIGTNFINEQFHNQGNSSDALVKFLQE